MSGCVLLDGDGACPWCGVKLLRYRIHHCEERGRTLSEKERRAVGKALMEMSKLGFAVLKKAGPQQKKRRAT